MAGTVHDASAIPTDTLHALRDVRARQLAAVHKRPAEADAASFIRELMSSGTPDTVSRRFNAGMIGITRVLRAMRRGREPA
ncbi:MAG: hypothetical protein KIT36_19405 [Alphaproteobacteria bacterium]|nr:hypothetical protein [Alphaproteobacteria bacterium]